MQEVAAAMSPPASVTLDQHASSEKAPRRTPHPGAAASWSDPRFGAAIAGEDRGACSLWAEVRRHWLGGELPA